VKHFGNANRQAVMQCVLHRTKFMLTLRHHCGDAVLVGVKTILERIDRTASSADADNSTTLAAPILIYVINLDRSIDRWERMRAQAVQYGLNIVRIAALDGQSLGEGKRPDFQPFRFFYHNGRAILGGEYGCYRSHLMALETFVESGDAMAIIMEDDVDLNETLIPRAIAAVDAVGRDAVVKLANHRKVGFRPLFMSDEGDVIGRCQHGPQGSAACYIVTRDAAERLLKTMRRIQLPYDVALERGWATGVETFSAEDNVVEFSPHRRDTTIGKRSDYRAAKPHFLLRTTAHWFRAHDQLRRWLYALSIWPRIRR
jgi:glycosyl transferase family 25